MRILFVCNEYPPSVHGGIGSFTRDIAEGLVNAGHNIIIFGLYNGLDKDIDETINGVRVIRKKYKAVHSRLNLAWFVWKLNNALKKFLKEESFDIVECQEWQGLLPFGLNHPAYVVRIHGASIFFDKLLNRPGNRLTHWLEIKTMQKAGHLVAVSDYCGRATLDFCDIKRDYTVIYNAINSLRIRANQTDTTKSFSIIFANSMLPKKGIFELAEAFNSIAAKYPLATLTYIGKTGYSQNGVNVKDLIKEHVNPEFRNRVSILGWLEKATDVYKHLSEATVCVYPSKMEGFGIAPVEAMVLCKPTIFMQDGPGPEVIEDGVSGLLANTNDKDDLAIKIEEIFSGKHDLEKMGKNAYDRAMRLFDLKTIFIPINIDYYNSIISR